MPTFTPTQLIDWLAKNLFLSNSQVDELRAVMATFPDSLALARELLRRDWLTAFQVNQIMRGEHEQLKLDDYQLRERIGEGAMGQVYKAWSVRMRCVVAIKTIRKERVPSALTLERFRREVQAASQLDHPNIAFVRDAGEADGKPYLVMEYIDGFNLTARVKQRGALPVHEAVEYVRQAALGLQHAQDRGVVHRDIKPSNLMVTTLRLGDDTHPIVKILDFGLARYQSEEDAATRLTKLGSLLGTVDYIAPEQAHDARSADIRADIYSLGCSLYFMLTGQPPFLGGSIVERIGPRLLGEPPWVRSLRPEVSPALEGLLRKIMARRPEDRYQTPIEVATALAPFAVPQTEAPASGVVMAMPVSPDAIIVGEVPMALPIGAPPAPITAAIMNQAPPEHPAPFDMPASGLDNMPPRIRPGKKPFPIKIALLAGGGILLLLSLCLGVWLANFLWRGGGNSGSKTGSIEITEAKLSVPDGTLRHLDRKFVLVKFKRSGFRGPVIVKIKNLPDGITCEDKTLDEKDRQTDIALNVSALTKAPLEQTIRVIIESEREGVSAEAPLQIRVVTGKKIKKG